MGFVEKILLFGDEYDMFPPSGTVLACVSGGADSMCLLGVLLDIASRRGFCVAAAHYNHNLRGDESVRDEAFVSKACREYNVRLLIDGSDVGAYARDEGMGIEEAARNLRYGFFHRAAESVGAVRIITAHTADDLAETVIMNLTRGAGTAGLSGIPPKRGMVVRPMLNVTRDEIVRYITEHGIAYVEDSTNSLTDRTRNKIRHCVVPVLREINPQFIKAAAIAAGLSRRDDEYLTHLAGNFIRAEARKSSLAPKTQLAADMDAYVDFRTLLAQNSEKPSFRVCAKTLHTLPLPVAGRVVRELCGAGLASEHVSAVLGLCGHDNPSAYVSVPGMSVRREYGDLVFDRGGFAAAVAAGEFTPVALDIGVRRLIYGDLGVSCSLANVNIKENEKFDKTFRTFLFHVGEICGRMLVRPRRKGDNIRLTGTGCTKSLKKLFIERRIPRPVRGLVPVIADDLGVLAVYGVGVGDRAVPADGGSAYKVEFVLDYI